MFTKTLKLMRPAAFIKAGPLVVGAVALILGAAFPAWAALGGDFASVQADQVHMQGKLRTTAMASYTVHEIQTASGTVCENMFLCPEHRRQERRREKFLPLAGRDHGRLTCGSAGQLLRSVCAGG